MGFGILADFATRETIGGTATGITDCDTGEDFWGKLIWADEEGAIGVETAATSGAGTGVWACVGRAGT